MPSQKKQSIEYRLLVQHTFDETIKKHGILFLLETTKQFTNFSYQIAVKQLFKGKDLVWSLHGLQAPSMNMPETGTAHYSAVYYDAPKLIRFTLIKKDAVRTEVEFKVLKSEIRASTVVSDFVKVYTDQAEFEANRSNDERSPELKKPGIHRTQITTTKKKKA